MSAVAERSWVEKVEEAVLSQLSSLFHDDRVRALDYARSLGFEPLAILPAEIWNQICQRFELYRFKMWNGQTYSKEFYPEWIIPSSVMFAFAACLATLRLEVHMLVNQDSSFLLVSALVVFAFVVFFAVLGYFHRLVFCCLSNRFLLRKLWPNLVSECKDHDVLIPVSFKTDELFRNKEIILRKKGVRYWVVSMPGAIQLRRVFTADKMLEACPVLYLEAHDCAIILAQCGDFPREKEAVEFAKMLAQGRFGSEN